MILMCKTNFEALKRASSFLDENNREKEVARYLLQHVLQKNYSELMITIYDEISPEAFEVFWDYVEEHATGRPFQYILGQESFYGRDFFVNEHVLIPRPETEELIEEVKKRVTKLFDVKKSMKIADIGTGSGAIALTIKNEIPNAEVTATDISPEALLVAKKNAENLHVQVEFKEGDLLAPIADQKWDVILSNPPYIGTNEAVTLSDTVIDYEPHLALFAEEDGLQLYRKMAAKLPDMMNTPSLIGFEIGFTQGPIVQKMLQNAFPQANVEVVQDINQKNRFIFCTITE